MRQLFIIIFLSLFAFSSSLIDGEYIATGYSAPGQSKYAAMISAKVDAQRELLEQIYSTKVTSTHTLGEKKSVVKTAISGVLRAARIVSKSYDKDTRMAQVVMKVSINKVIKTLKKKKVLQESFYDDVKVDILPKITKPIDIVYDGLIVNTKGIDVEPAIYNNIFVDDKILFNPSELEVDLGIDDGMTMITSNIKTAKSFLSSYGVENPMVVNAIGTHEMKSNIVISLNDANKILQDNKKNKFLNKCRVVYIIKKAK